MGGRGDFYMGSYRSFFTCFVSNFLEIFYIFLPLISLLHPKIEWRVHKYNCFHKKKPTVDEQVLLVEVLIDETRNFALNQESKTKSISPPDKLYCKIVI